ncbi:Os05g0583100 [Oryza sativa Japonica Group]|jgi:hypothetical protein|uniref:Os05g0583100 protein n=2 Tax=Oryza sativa subsp. japonica TaxID=39947 RepID=B9FLT4_ORYSJ|nr:hypothetical protein OsJ_19693 [Oryza sativa Japonica Group]KAB8100772.1 hypothetical protein EE612_031377 [Oryza sativa]BAS95546.1 Os05g0583100 [Oryza sativa Japonica Group]
MALDNGQELRLLQALRRQVQVWLHLRCHLQKGEFKGDDGDVAFKVNPIPSFCPVHDLFSFAEVLSQFSCLFSSLGFN